MLSLTVLAEVPSAAAAGGAGVGAGAAAGASFSFASEALRHPPAFDSDGLTAPQSAKLAMVRAIEDMEARALLAPATAPASADSARILAPGPGADGLVLGAFHTAATSLKFGASTQTQQFLSGGDPLAAAAEVAPAAAAAPAGAGTGFSFSGGFSFGAPSSAASSASSASSWGGSSRGGQALSSEVATAQPLFAQPQAQAQPQRPADQLKWAAESGFDVTGGCFRCDESFAQARRADR
jgi:hypothetical protein